MAYIHTLFLSRILKTSARIHTHSHVKHNDIRNFISCDLLRAILSAFVYVVPRCVKENVLASKVVIHTAGRKRIFMFHVNANGGGADTRSFQLMRRDKSSDRAGPTTLVGTTRPRSGNRSPFDRGRTVTSLVLWEETADRQSDRHRRCAKLQSDSCQHLSRAV